MTALITDARSAVRAYIEGAAGDGRSAAANVAAWQQLSIRPRVMVDVRTIDTTIELFGRTLPTPVFAAPWAGQGFAHPGGEVATAQASAAVGATLGLSSGSTRSIESVAAVSGPYLQQVYLPSDRRVIEPFLTRVVAAGAFALALTVDNPHTPRQHGFRAGLGTLDRSVSENFPEVRDRSTLASSAHLTPADIAWLTEFTGLPVLVKGVLREDDARRAVDGGAAGIIVSNHAGRQLDGVLPTADALPHIVAAVGADVPVLVDGGIRTGADVLRALALGAAAVLVGRPLALALLENGREGVQTVLADLVGDLHVAMAMTGSPRIADITRDLLA